MWPLQHESLNLQQTFHDESILWTWAFSFVAALTRDLESQAAQVEILPANDRNKQLLQGTVMNNERFCFSSLTSSQAVVQLLIHPVPPHTWWQSRAEVTITARSKLLHSTHPTFLHVHCPLFSRLPVSLCGGVNMRIDDLGKHYSVWRDNESISYLLLTVSSTLCMMLLVM